MKIEDCGLNRDDPVKIISSRRVVHLEVDDTLATALRKHIATGLRRFPVTDRKGNLVGIVTTLDILSEIYRGTKHDERVAKFMTKGVKSCDENGTVEDAVRKMKLTRRGGLPITSAGKLKGIITERDIVKNFDKISFGKRIGDIMVRKPLVAKHGSLAHDAWKTMISARLRRLPVVENKKVIGVVTAQDILHHLIASKLNSESAKIPVNEVIRTFVVKADKNTDVSEGIKIMNASDVGGLVIVDEQNNLEGIITDRDILEHID